MRLTTTFPGFLPAGVEVVAVPEPDADSVEQIHDVAHHIVASALGLDRSPTLWRLATGDTAVADDALVAFEEAAVLAVQQYARELLARGVSVRSC